MPLGYGPYDYENIYHSSDKVEWLGGSYPFYDKADAGPEPPSGSPPWRSRIAFGSHVRSWRSIHSVLVLMFAFLAATHATFGVLSKYLKGE